MLAVAASSCASPAQETHIFPDDDDLSEHMEHTSISGLFSDAALYRQAIVEHEPSDGVYRVLDPNVTSAAQRSVHDFAELVGKDLEPAEKDVASQFAQLSVEEWAPHEGDADTSLTQEPDGFSDDEFEEASSGEDSTEIPRRATTSTEASTSTSTSDTALADEELPVVLAPDEIVALLIQEFGPLGPDGEEKLISEVDAAIIQDVVILGVVHITTHRITFHASVPASDTSPSSTKQIIKSGNAVVHRKGLHRKRRVWMELSHDFVTSYPSAREEDHIKPWRSVMLKSILEICPEDPLHPRVIKACLDGKSGIKEGNIEFDTVESARDWRRELQAALFFSRRKMREYLAEPDSDDVEGVRICIPLDRIAKHTHHIQANIVPIVSLTIAPVDTLTGQSVSEISSQGAGAQVIELAAYKIDEKWHELDDLISKSKTRLLKDINGFPNRNVVVDFGLSDDSTAREESEPEPPRSKDQIVCDMLAVEYDPATTWVTRACISSGLATFGFLVVTPDWVCFWSKSLALRDVRYRLETQSIRSVAKGGSTICSIILYGMVLQIEGHSDLRLHFRTESLRNEAIRRITEVSQVERPSLTMSPTSTPPLSPSSETFPSRMSPRRSKSNQRSQSLLSPISRSYSVLRSNLDPHKALQFPKAVNVPAGIELTITPRHFVCLTIGSRGDVQPYIALGIGLKKEGHEVTIVTHPEYKDWIEGFGLRHRAAGGDPGALMQLSVENKMFSPQFFKTSLSNYRSWLDHLLIDAWESCCDADVLLESPYAMAGVHIAEALHIPYFRVCTMPWTKTTEFPHPFIGPPLETATANSISYVLFDNIFWAATSGQINRWRREHLNLEAIVMSHTAQSKIPILYNFSSAVVPKPLDWSESKFICGYWFLDNPDLDWTPPPTLLEFMRKAREDNKPLVYIGFGSITVPNPQTMTERIYDAVVKSGVRAIVSRGWSSRMSKKEFHEVAVPEEVYMVDKVPHDWLFPQLDAALHHGGAGTTGASLRAGIPTLIKPWFGDQYFWASRVHKLGAGQRVASLRVNDLSHALTRATTDRLMKEKAAIVGQKIRAEDGVSTAIRAIYTYLPRAFSEGLPPE